MRHDALKAEMALLCPLWQGTALVVSGMNGSIIDDGKSHQTPSMIA